MSIKHISCEEMGFKVMAFLDNELPHDEIKQVKNHIETCEVCKDKFESLKKVKEITSEMKFKKLPEMYWDEYWRQVYNRIERGISWIFISIGTIIVLSFTLIKFVSSLIADQQMDPFLKGGIFVLLIGSTILLISVIREKIMVKRVDKYREVER